MHSVRTSALCLAVVASVAALARDARACGGCFHEPQPPNQSGTVVTDHRMIFSISLQQTTLYDEIKYAGSPSSFAWVLPIRGQVTVGLSSDEVFAALEQATATDIIAPPLPACPICNCGGLSAGFADGGSGSSGGGSSSGGVTILSQKTIGPYEAVQLQSTAPNALDTWLATNGYVIPSDVQPIIAAYVAESFDFLALKLAPGEGVQAMRPVRVTAPGAALSLPLRMVAAGTGAAVGITLWVVADGRYEPYNFPFFTISPADLTWDWSAGRSNYTTVQVAKEAASNNSAWQIESSLPLSPFAIQNIIASSGAPFGSSSSGSGTGDYVPLPGPDGGPGQTAAEEQMADIGALFPEGNVTVRMTRMRASLLRPALGTDLVLTASADQRTLSNIYQVTQSVNAPQCSPCACSTTPGTSSGFSTGMGGSSGSSGSSPGGSSGSAGGASPTKPSPGESGCAASVSEPGNGAVTLIAAGFVGVTLVRSRRKRS
jgi:hypothetical protein